MTTWRPPQHMRATVQALVRKGRQFLVFDLSDLSKGQSFYRPVGGADLARRVLDRPGAR